MMRASKAEIQLADRSDRWRFVCPRGHRSWEPTNHHFWCQKCARNYGDDVDPEFDELHDRKTDEMIPRDRLVLRNDELRPNGGKA